MQASQKTQRLKIIIAAASVVLIIGLIVVVAYNAATKNPYGESIPINNYDATIKNLSSEYKNSISAALYQMVVFNSSDNKKANSVRDAIIRNDSALQEEVSKNKQYSGSFIIDMESIKQSYLVQYTYSTNKNDGFMSGYPVLVSCLSADKLIYGDFSCKDIYETTGGNISDPIINSLPKTTLSYKLYADTSSGKLVIKAELRIPSSDLVGDEPTKRQVVDLYKNEVAKWFESTGFEPSNYTIKYNYDDVGNEISL